MAYLVAQLRKNERTTYMSPISVSSSTIMSPNPFGDNDDFEDFALAPVPTGSQLTAYFYKGLVYYLRFRIHKIPQYFYSGIDGGSKADSYASAETLGLTILLKNDGLSELDKPPEIIGSCTVPMARRDLSNSYSMYSFIFTPSKNFNRIGFRINRINYDAILSNNNPRNWLLDSTTDVTVLRCDNQGNRYNITTIGPRIFYGNSIIEELKDFSDFCALENLVLTTPPKERGWLKFGYQCRPGAQIVVNKEPIIVGRSGIYLINNGTIIKEFMIASPGGSDRKKIDAFLLDYAYDDRSNN